MLDIKLDDKFAREPLRVEDGIPIFCETDPYVQNYERIAKDHVDAMRPGMDNPFIGDELWRELDQSTRLLIEKHLAVGSSILDVGVGLGRVLGTLAQYDRHGIDISMDYLRRARDAGIAVAFGRVEALPHKDETFDAVMACDVLEHVFDLYGCVKQMLRVLKPGGYLFVRVPYREDLKVYLQEGLPYEFIHVRSFDENSIQLLFQKVHGCTVLGVTTVAPYWQGETRLRFRVPASGDSIHSSIKVGDWKRMGIDSDGLRILRSLAEVSSEELVAWMNRMQQDSPLLFRSMCRHLLWDIEMNVVVQKPKEPRSELGAR